MANRGDNAARRGNRLRCFACGGRIEPPLEALGSLRCLDCRDLDRPLAPPARARLLLPSIGIRLRRPSWSR